MSELLVLPDIHGRVFWKRPCEDIDRFKRVVFLGDYADPYIFEEITPADALDNLKEIIELKEAYPDKVILLLGNHDMPYFSDDYLGLHWGHSRHSKRFHDAFHELFNQYKSLFQLAYVEDDVLFTHAGVDSRWLETVVGCQSDDIHQICDALNHILDKEGGMKDLFKVSWERGGWDEAASCIWADVSDIMKDVESAKAPDAVVKPIHRIKQVFGHTLQAYEDRNGDVHMKDAVEFDNCKMLDNAQPYILNTDDFTIRICE